ncbi:MAG: acyloxyacyl hydrolase [bacterium]
MPHSRLRPRACLALIVLGLLPHPARAQPDELVVSVGAFDFVRPARAGRDLRTAIAAEYRPAIELGWLEPFIGFLATTGGSILGYGGLSIDLPLVRDELLLTPSLALAGFKPDPSEDLGSTIVFRTGADLRHPIAAVAWIGIGVFHVSNGGLADHNPGAESVTLSVSRSFDW